MVDNILFGNPIYNFQHKLNDNIKKMKERKIYGLENPDYEKLLRENITKNYKIIS